MYQCRARKAVVCLVVFHHGDVKVYVDALVLLELKISPLPVVHPLLQCLLQIVEYRLVRAFYLLTVDVNLHQQFLSPGRHPTPQQTYNQIFSFHIFL